MYGASPLGQIPIGIYSANNEHVCDNPSRWYRGHNARRVLEQSRFRWPAGRRPGRPGRPRSPGKSSGSGGVVFSVNLFRLCRVRRLAVPDFPSGIAELTEPVYLAWIRPFPLPLRLRSTAYLFDGRGCWHRRGRGQRKALIAGVIAIPVRASGTEQTGGEG
jgi:hypothetical protein